MPTIESLEQALRDARRSGDQETTIKALCALGKRYLDADALEQSLERLGEAAALAQQIKSRFLLGHAMRYLGQVYARQRVDGRAVECYRLAERIGEEYNAPLLVLDGAYGRATLAARDGRVEEAVAAYRVAIDAANNNNDAAQMMALLKELGAFAMKMRLLETALQAYQRMKAAVEAIEDQEGIVVALTGIGQAHLGLNHFEDAAHSFRQAFAPAQKLNNPHLMEPVLVGLKEALEELGEDDQIAELMSYRVEVAQNSGDPTLEYHARLALARFLEQQNSVEQALTHYEVAAQLAAQIGEEVGELDILRAIVGAYERSGFDYMVINAHQAVIDRAMALKQRSIEIDARLDMARQLRKLGDTTQALRVLEAAREVAKVGVDRRREAHCLLDMAEIHVQLDNATAVEGMMESAERALSHDPDKALESRLDNLKRALKAEKPSAGGLLGRRIDRD